MKVVRASLFIVAVLGFLVLCGPAWAVEPNLVSHWKFDETSGTIAYDSIGSNDGTLVNGPVWTTGQIGGGLSFSGGDDYVDCGSSFASITGSATKTITAWAKSDVSDQTVRIITLYRRSDSYSAFAISLRENDGGNPATWKGLYATPGNSYKLIDSEVSVTAGEWTHIALVQDGTDVHIYVDGELKNSANDAATPAISNPPHAVIGTYMWYGHGPSPSFLGSIDDVRIYNRALSAEEIQQLYQNGVGELIGLEITGPAEVAENFQMQYAAIAYYDNNSTRDVTDSAQWFVEPNAIASINGNGLLTTEEIYIPEEDITIYAQYMEDTNTVEAEKAVSVLAICPTGTALSFDGVNDYVDVGDPGDGSLDFGTADFTLSVWFKTSMSAPGLFVCKRAKGYYAGYDFYIESDGKIFARIADGSSVPDARTTEGFNDGLWHHAAAVYDRDGVIRIYVDSVSKATSGSIEWIGNVDNSEPFTIGDRNDLGYHSYFDGTIDDVRIYDRALSAEEIQANMHILLSGDEPNLVGYWGFDEGEGQVAYDLSGNSNNGYLGSDPCDVDSADPAWVESDAPIGICTTGGLIERNITRALESKQRALEEIEAALANENATIGVLEALFRSRDYGNLDKNDIVKAKQEIHSAVQNEQRSTDTLEKSIEKLEDSLSALGYEVEPNGSNN